MGKVIRYEEKYDPNHSQECICHRGPMNRGLEESPDGSYVDYEEYEKLKQRYKRMEDLVIKFRQGVTRFNRSRGDMSLLLTAYADCEQLRKEQE